MFLILLAILAISFIYLKVIKPYSHFSSRGIKQRKQTYLLGDSARSMFRKESFVDTIKGIYNAFPEERYVGSYQFTSPSLMLRDADLIKQITVKYFDHFMDHKQVIPEDVDPLFTKNLVALTGDRWRDMRATLSPSFTSSKMRGIFSLIHECSMQYSQHFMDKKQDLINIELKDTFSRYANDIIAIVAFGIECDSLKDPGNEFYVRGKEATNFNSFFRRMRFLIHIIVPPLAKLLGITLFPKHLNEFFLRVVKETMQMREEKGVVRPDMLNLLMEAQKGRLKPDDSNAAVDTSFATVEESNIHSDHKIVKKELTTLDIAAQAMIFFFAGFDTVSTAMSFMGYQLTVNPNVQRRLQEEIDETLKECGGKLTYEALMKMKYMDMVVSESLRMWPPAIATDRICIKPYTIHPIRASERPVQLQKGDVVWIPIIGLHWDPQYFPNSEVFDPERFSDDNKANIQPYTYLPFGAGPRNCIGSRFALLEVKALFFELLRNFDLVVTDKTEVPLKISKSIGILPDNGIWIGLKPRSLSN